jgi:hypothetical protein
MNVRLNLSSSMAVWPARSFAQFKDTLRMVRTVSDLACSRAEIALENAGDQANVFAFETDDLKRAIVAYNTLAAR